MSRNDSFNFIVVHSFRVQVTPANNQVLIKKYEALYGKDENDGSSMVDIVTSPDSDVSPKLPPRSKIRSN